MMSVMNGTLSARGRLRGWLLAALLLTLPLGAAAQELAPDQCQDPPCPPFSITVQGTITNCAGQPLPGVTVLIQGDFANTSAVTNSFGRYSRTVQRGDYTVTPVPTARHFFSPQSQGSNGEVDANFTRYPRDNRANFDGDCKTDVSDFNRSSGLWHSLNSSNGQHVFFGFGLPADVITPGDYNGDGRTDYAVFRPSDATWYVATEVGTAFSAVQFGETADVPAAADYDGDGRADIAVQRPDSTGAFWILPSSTGSHYAVSGFGEFPVPLGYLSTRNWY